MKIGIGMTIVIDRLRGEEDRDIAIAITRDIDRQTTAAVAVHVEGNLDSARRVVRL
jgi:predicted translin family RNA/ssDNA-binding protein